MLPAFDLILECPYCGGEKPVIQLMSGNTFGATQWWDLKIIYPMLPRYSAVQKCPHCQKYFFVKDAKQREGDSCSMDKGELSYEEAKEAWSQLSSELSTEGLIQLALIYLHKYNDVYQRIFPENTENVTHKEFDESELTELIPVVRYLVENFSVESPLIHAEFLRNAQLFDEAMAIVNNTPLPTEPIYIALRNNIIENCKSHNSTVNVVAY